MSGERLRRHHHRQRRRRRDAGRAPRAVGQEGPHPRARRLAAARDRELGRRRGVRQEPLRLEGHLVRRQGQGVPARHPLLRRRPDEVLRRGPVPAAARGLRRAAPPRRHLARVAHHATTSSSRTTRRRSSCTRSTAPAARTRPSPRRARRTRSRPSSHEPRIQQLSDDLARAGYHPFHAPCGVRLLEDDMPNSPCIRCATCDGFPSLVQAKSDAEIFGVRPALEHPNVTLLTNARATQADDRRGRQRRSRASRSSATAPPRRTAATSSSSRPAPPTPPSCCSPRPTTATRTGSRTAPTRSAATTCSTTARRCWRSPRSRTRRKFQKTLGVNDFYFGMQGLRVPDGQHPDGRQVVGADVPRREAARDQARADVHARRGRQARRRLLAVDRGPGASPENRVTLAKDGNITLSYTPNNQEPKKRLYNQLKSMLGHLGMHPDHLIPRTTYLKNEIPIAGVAHQAGTVRFGTDPATSALDVELQGARAGQPVRRRHELLPEHRRGEPGPDRDRQLAAGRRPPARAARRVGRRVAGREAVASGSPARPPPEGSRTMPTAPDRREVVAVYAAGLAQGVALVTFPAASSILTSPDWYGLSSTAYGGLFLPQAIAAIAASLAGARLAGSIGPKRLLLTGLAGDLLAMTLLFVSQFLIGAGPLAVPRPARSRRPASGSGSGSPCRRSTPSPPRSSPSGPTARCCTSTPCWAWARRSRRCSSRCSWASASGRACRSSSPWCWPALLLVRALAPARGGGIGRRTAAQGGGLAIPPQFWIFAAFAVCYGVVETMNGNWATVYMTQDLGRVGRRSRRWR